MTDETQVVEGQAEGDAIETPSVLDTPEIKQPAAKPQAHRGRIEAVKRGSPATC